MPRAGLSADRVVEAALELSDQVGLANLTLAELAARLGVRQPSLYKHIDGMGALHREMAIRAKNELAAELARCAVGRSGDDAIISIAGAYRRWAGQHPGHYGCTVRAPAPDDARDEAASRAVVVVVTDILAGYGLSGDDAIHATRALRAALHGFVSLEAAGGFGMPVDIDTSYERLIATIVAGLPDAGQA